MVISQSKSLGSSDLSNNLLVHQEMYLLDQFLGSEHVERLPLRFPLDIDSIEFLLKQDKNARSVECQE